MNILNQTARPFATGLKHIDTLQVRLGYFFPVEPIRTLHLGGAYRQHQLELMLDDDARFWSNEGREL